MRARSSRTTRRDDSSQLLLALGRAPVRPPPCPGEPTHDESYRGAEGESRNRSLDGVEAADRKRDHRCDQDADEDKDAIPPTDSDEDHAPDDHLEGVQGTVAMDAVSRSG